MSRIVSASEQMSGCLDDKVMVSVVDVLPDIILQKGLSTLRFVEAGVCNRWPSTVLPGDRSLADCFKLFDVIHQLTTEHATITRITKEVRNIIEDARLAFNRRAFSTFGAR